MNSPPTISKQKSCSLQGTTEKYLFGEWHITERTKAWEAVNLGLNMLGKQDYGDHVLGVHVVYDPLQVRYLAEVKLYKKYGSGSRTRCNGNGCLQWVSSLDALLMSMVEDPVGFPSEHLMVKLLLATGSGGSRENAAT